MVRADDATIFAVAGVAWVSGGTRAVVLAFVWYGVVVLPLVILVFTVGAFGRGLRSR